jgi:Domain of unknown function (DUF4062)
MKPPTFFLSSTIYDFHDLRSAIKYYLEQQGCRVLASDFNDFAKPLDVHSYEACLRSIEQADYFVLLIGARVGGWYDEAKRVSITQREYQEAYRLHKEGKLKLLNFVRADVWRMREDRKELAKHLDTLGFDPGAKERIASYASKAATDAEFISGFITEVGRNRETAAAAKGQGPLPTGNWLHIFETFKDVIEPIQMQAFCGKPVEEVAMRRLLRMELLDLLRVSLLKIDGGVATDPAEAVQKLYAGILGSLDIMEDYSPSVAVDRATLFHLFQITTTISGKMFYPHILPIALASSTFLDFDGRSGKMAEQPVYRALFVLTRELELFKLVDKVPMTKSFMDYLNEMSNTRADRSPTVLASRMHLATVMHTLDRWVNISKLCKAIIKHLDGAPFVMPKLQRRSPLYQDEAMSRFEATEHDTEWYLGLPGE